MPNGRTHDIITFVVAPVVAGISYYITKDIRLTGILMGLYLFSSLMFNGDLDMNSKPYNRWWLLKMIWIPYQLMFNHRSVFTHGLIIGTIIRMVYVGIIPVLYLYFTGKMGLITGIDSNMLLIGFIGLESGAAVHTIADKLF